MASWTASSAARARALAVVAATVFGVASPALAEDTRDPVLAQSLFDRARSLMDQGRFAEACPLLAESQRLDPGGGTQLNLAVCLEQAGKLATAHATFHEALSRAIREGRDDRRRIAEERIAAITPRLSTLTVEVPADARVPGLTVWLDGAKLTSLAWGAPTAVDGGDHRVEATAPDRAPWATTVTVQPERDLVKVRVVAPRAMFEDQDEDDEPEGAGLVTGRPREKRAQRETRLSTASWVTGGVGLGLLVAGGAMGIAAVVEDDRLEAEAQEDGCNLKRHFCPDDDADEYEARAADNQALGWAASASMATGAVLLLVAPLLPRDVVEVQRRLGLSVGLASVSLRGSF